jgi:hypothetical protein
MQKLNLPDSGIKISEHCGELRVFDPIRKKNIKLTPEEWVRQNMAMYLINTLGYPQGLMAIEMGIKVNKLHKRTDIVAFSSKGKPLLIVECKAPHIPINQAVFDQIARYNIPLGAEYLLVSNGLVHICCRIMPQCKPPYMFLEHIPCYKTITT